MRRKSDRKAKSSPEKKTPEVATRRSHRRKRQKSESSSEPETPNTAPVVEPEKEQEAPVVEVIKQTSNSNSDEEKTEQPVWQVKTSESPGGEIQKLKICLQRPSSTPERTERSPRRSRKYKHGTSLSQTDEEVNDSCEERSTRSKDRRKNKKSRKSSSTGSGVEDSSQESLSVIEKSPSHGDKSPFRDISPARDEKSLNEKSPQSNDSLSKSVVPSHEDKLSSSTESVPCDKVLGIVQLTTEESVSLDKISGEVHDDSVIEVDTNINMQEDSNKNNISNEDDKTKSEDKFSQEECKECETTDVQKIVDSEDNVVDCEHNEVKDKIEENSLVIKSTSEETNSNVNIANSKKVENIIEKSVTDLEILICTSQKENEKMEINTEEENQNCQKLSEASMEIDTVKDSKVEDKNLNENIQEKSPSKFIPSEVQLIDNATDQNKILITTVEKDILEEKNEEEKISKNKNAEDVCREENKNLCREETNENVTRENSDDEMAREKCEKVLKEKNDEEISKRKNTEDTSDSEQSVHEDNIEPQNSKLPIDEMSLNFLNKVTEVKNQNVTQEKDQNITVDKSIVTVNEDNLSEVTSSFTDETESNSERVDFDRELHNVNKLNLKEKNVDFDETKESSKNSVEFKNIDSKDSKSNIGKMNTVNNKITTVSTTIMHPQVIEIHVAPLDPARKRSRWKNVMNNLYKTNFKITSYDVKEICPDIEMLTIDEVYLELDTRIKSSKSSETEAPPRKMRRKSEDDKLSNSPKETSVLSPIEKSQMMDINPLLANRKISIVSDEASNFQQPLSPAKNDPSSILHVKNLVRPFTLNQLKELLSRTGNIVENGFWINKIKSECYVQYESEDQAIETRNALHGVHWPVANGRRLDVDFGTKEDMDKARNPPVENKLVEVPKLEPTPEIKPKEEIIDWREERERERVRREQRGTREWDVGKHGGRSPSPRHRKHSPPPRSPSPEHKSKKKEDVPVKLLDDLFRKTKATPCIYWLPLSAEMIVIKEEQRRKHMAEHERRMAEIRRAERMRRNSGRGPRGPPRHD